MKFCIIKHNDKDLYLHGYDTACQYSSYTRWTETDFQWELITCNQTNTRLLVFENEIQAYEFMKSHEGIKKYKIVNISEV